MSELGRMCSEVRGYADGLEKVVAELSVRIAREHRRKRNIRLLWEAAITAATVFLLFGVIFGIAVIDGDSMAPGMPGGSVAVFLRMSGAPSSGDVVVFADPSGKGYLVKRVVATEGENVSIDHTTGTLLVDGVPEKENGHSGGTYIDGNSVQYPYIVPEKMMFVLGDNRKESKDSRHYGAVDTRSVAGKVLLVIKRP